MSSSSWPRPGVEIFEYVHGQSLTPKNCHGQDHVERSGLRRRSAPRGSRASASTRRTPGCTRPGRVVGGRVFGYRNRVRLQRRGPRRQPAAVPRRARDRPGRGRRRAAHLRALRRGRGAEADRQAAHARRRGRSRSTARRTDGLQPVVGWSPVHRALRPHARDAIAASSSGTRRGSATTWGKWAPTAARSRTGCAPRPSTCASSTTTSGSASQSRREGPRARPRGSPSGRLSGRPPKHATQNLLAGLATCARLRRRAGRRDERQEARAASGIRLPPAPRERQLHERAPHARRGHERGRAPSRRGTRADARGHRAGDSASPSATTSRTSRPRSTREQQGHREAHRAARRRHRDGRRRRVARRQAPRAGSAAARHRTRDSAALRPVPRLAPAVIEDRLAEWRRLLRASTTQGRTVLQRILRGRLTFTPRSVSDEAGLRLRGADALRQAVHGHCRRRPAEDGSEPGDAGALRGHRPRGHVRRRLRATLGNDAHAKGVVRPEGLEPPAYRFEACRSIQLSYGRPGDLAFGHLVIWSSGFLVIDWWMGRLTMPTTTSIKCPDNIHQSKCPDNQMTP